MSNEEYFIIVIGESNNEKKQILEKRVKSMKPFKKLSDNIYVVGREKTTDTISIAKLICGSEMLHAMIIHINTSLNAAWGLDTESSTYLKTLFNSLYKNEEQKRE